MFSLGVSPSCGGGRHQTAIIIFQRFPTFFSNVFQHVGKTLEYFSNVFPTCWKTLEKRWKTLENVGKRWKIIPTFFQRWKNVGKNIPTFFQLLETRWNIFQRFSNVFPTSCAKTRGHLVPLHIVDMFCMCTSGYLCNWVLFLWAMGATLYIRQAFGQRCVRSCIEF